MLKALTRPTLITSSFPGASPQASPHTNGDEEPARQATQDTGRSSVGPQNDEGHHDIGDGTSSTAAGQSAPVFYAGVMLRGHKGDLARFFELPPSENLLGDFHCALRKRVLLQGRIYVFNHYVCFYSAVFGFAKKRRIPMRTIKAVRKKTHLGFPNSLEIETDERKDFFTSFLSREEAFQLVQKLVPEAKRLAEEGGGDNSGRRPSNETSSTLGAASRDAGGQQRGGSGAAGGEAGRQGNGGEGGGGASGNGTSGRPMGLLGMGGERSLLTRNSGSMGDDNEDDEEEEAGLWVPEARPAPPLLPGCRHVLHSSLPGCPREFFEAVLADSAPFFEDFLDSQGNRRINLTSWKRHPQLGHVRDLHFTAPIKGAFGNWGVSHTACYQSHRFCLYTPDHIVFESSQTMTDIPYGDCFTVDQRWDVKRDAGAEPDKPQITFDVHVRVPFTSRCLFKGVIESGSFKQVQETFANFVEQLRPVMQERITSRKTLHMRDPCELGPPSASPTPRIGRPAAAANGGPPPRLLTSSLRTSMQHLPSFRNHNNSDSPDRSGDADGSGAPRGSGGGDPSHPHRQHYPQQGAPADPRLGISMDFGPMGHSHHHHEPGVGRLLVSLGGRLAEGLRGLLEAGVELVLSLTRAESTPALRALVAAVLLLLAVNLLFLGSNMWA
ncbi:hypothetical protein Agub_g7415, partial [Astrephomene gubernaculifera]